MGTQITVDAEYNEDDGTVTMNRDDNDDDCCDC